jgi:hypothetical protein
MLSIDEISSTKKDNLNDQNMYYNHRIIHAIFLIFELFVKSYVFKEDKYGMGVDGAETQIKCILQKLAFQNGIDTGNIRRKEHLLEITRSQTIAYSIWMGMTSPITNYLFNWGPKDEYIGFNHRIIAWGIRPFAVITKDQIIDGLSLLSFIFIHPLQDNILKIIGLEMCKLNQIDIDKYFTVADGKMDYSYICVKSISKEKFVGDISGQLRVKHHVNLSDSDIWKILNDLTSKILDLYLYEKVKGRTGLTVQRDENNAMISKGMYIAKMETDGKKFTYWIALHYIKAKFSTHINDSFVENPDKNTININKNSLNINTNDNYNKEYDIIKPYFLLNEENPFIKTIKTYYENNVLDLTDTSKKRDEDYDKEYTTEEGIKPFQRYITGFPCDDYEYDRKNRPFDVVNLSAVMKIVELVPNKHKAPQAVKNQRTITESTLLTVRSATIRPVVGGEPELIQFSDKILYDKINNVSKPPMDFDYEHCVNHLEKFFFPGFHTVDTVHSNRSINFQRTIFHVENQLQFIQKKKNIKQSDIVSTHTDKELFMQNFNEKIIYPERDILTIINNDREIREANENDNKDNGSDDNIINTATSNKKITTSDLDDKVINNLDKLFNQYTQNFSQTNHLGYSSLIKTVSDINSTNRSLMKSFKNMKSIKEKTDPIGILNNTSKTTVNNLKQLTVINDPIITKGNVSVKSGSINKPVTKTNDSNSVSIKPIPKPSVPIKNISPKPVQPELLNNKDLQSTNIYKTKWVNNKKLKQLTTDNENNDEDFIQNPNKKKRKLDDQNSDSSGEKKEKKKKKQVHTLSF